ncbi:GTP 3',8-cyclase MoaA [Paenibacillus sp. J5C_2022]|uniref:GTP 3',8-cyclase MoaA n=1 Tax=Paenibacillus sp. J5C2022 TaxID=2977129 RepID=UPI0021CE3F64|nr:GTP 3',8-cyclase MoaA [Paenibacillus sp. J5C2022]MCU6710407.1 GTP 3',8-cyclase MoaA [Paenibacillus sp. J5C2022]
MQELTDRFGRAHHYLRISVTDRCNLRCLYCMPEEGASFTESDKLLSYDDIEKVVRAGASLGIRKLRITGGEPLVRPRLAELIQRLSRIPGITDIAMTTNGIFLAKEAHALKAAGLNRVNISLDTLDPARFRLIARSGGIQRVLEGIESACDAGFHPVKLNCVLLKGLNEDEIAAFLELAYEKPLHVRFIEYMPIGHADDGWKKHYLPLQKVMDIARQQGYRLTREDGVTGSGPSENWQMEGAQGSFGLIHPVSDQFCRSCNRLRLTADGHLKPCLYWVDELNVKQALGSEEDMKQLFYRAMAIKPENHEMAMKLAGEGQSHTPTSRRMSQIGG